MKLFIHEEFDSEKNLSLEVHHDSVGTIHFIYAYVPHFDKMMMIDVCAFQKSEFKIFYKLQNKINSIVFDPDFDSEHKND